MFVPDTTEELVGITQIAPQFLRHFISRQTVAYANIQAKFYFSFELIRVPPYPVGEVKPVYLPFLESLPCALVGAEITAFLFLCQLADVIPKYLPCEFAVFVVGERPFRPYPVDYN